MQSWLDGLNWVHVVTIPIFTGVVGFLINWSGLWMLFAPVRFHGVRVPGMRELAACCRASCSRCPG